MEQDDTDIAAAAAAQMAAAAALHRKNPGKAGLPNLLLLRGDIFKVNATTKGQTERKEGKLYESTLFSRVFLCQIT